MKGLIYVFVLLLPWFAEAQVNETLKRYHVKKNVELILKDEVESLIKTKLSEDTFQVDLKVSLKPLQARSVNSGDESSDVEPRIKLFDLQRIIEAYKQNTEDVEKTDFPEIAGVDIIVGLSEFYTSSFRNRFQSWLSTMLRSRIGETNLSFNLIEKPQDPDFNEKGEDLEDLKDELKALERKMQEELNDLNRGVIDKIADVKDDLKDELSDISKPPAGLMEHLKDFQDLLGWLIFGIFLYSAVAFLAKNFKPLVETRNENFSRSETKSEGGGELLGEEVIEDSMDMTDEVDMGTASELSLMEDMCLNIALDQRVSLTLLFDYWLQGSTLDNKKFWALMSLCFRVKDETSQVEFIIDEMKSFVVSHNLEWSEDAFNSISKRNPDELASAVYNDLVRLKTFGIKSFNTRFASLRGLLSRQISDLVKEIGYEEIIFLFLTESQKEGYLAGLSESKKLAVLESSMKLLEVNDSMINELELKVNHWISQHKSDDYSDKVISLAHKIKETFGALSIDQKLEYVEQVKRSNINAYESLCRSHFDPIWFSEFKTNFIQDILLLLDYKSILYLSALSEDNKLTVLEFSPPRQVKMLEDENMKIELEKIINGRDDSSNVRRKIEDTVDGYLSQKNTPNEEAYAFDTEVDEVA